MGGDLDELVVPVGPSKVLADPVDNGCTARAKAASTADPVTIRRRTEPPSQLPTMR